jgi:hypothetical protein
MRLEGSGAWPTCRPQGLTEVQQEIVADHAGRTLPLKFQPRLSKFTAQQLICELQKWHEDITNFELKLSEGTGTPQLYWIEQ